MKNLLTLKFWFNFRPDALIGSSQKILIAIIVVLVILAIATSIFKKKNKNNLYNNFFSSMESFFVSNAIIGVILFFFSYELIPFLSARFWFLIWAIEMIIWLFQIVRPLKKIPAVRKEIEKKQEFRKYIP